MKCHKPIDDTHQEVQKMRNLRVRLKINCSMLELTTNSVTLDSLVDDLDQVMRKLIGICYSESMELQQDIFKYAKALSGLLKTSDESRCNKVVNLIRLASRAYECISQRQAKRKLDTQIRRNLGLTKLNQESEELLFWIGITTSFLVEQTVAVEQVQDGLAHQMNRFLTILKALIKNKENALNKYKATTDLPIKAHALQTERKLLQELYETKKQDFEATFKMLPKHFGLVA